MHGFYTFLMFLSKRCRYAMINLSYKYNTDIQAILLSFSFPGTPYRRVPSQKSPADHNVCLSFTYMRLDVFMYLCVHSLLWGHRFTLFSRKSLCHTRLTPFGSIH